MLTDLCRSLLGLAFITFGVINFWNLSINSHNWSNKEQFMVILLGLGEIVLGGFCIYLTFCF